MKKILVHLHIYYEEYYPKLKECIERITTQKFDLFITMPSNYEKTINDIKNNFPEAVVDIVENRGYDVGPFIEVINKVNLDDYDYIVKLHTKRDIKDFNSTYLTNGFKAFGDKWRNELLSFMENWEELINLLEKNKDVGMVGGLGTILNNKLDKNNMKQEYVKEICNILGINFENMKYNFVAGTMFIVRANIFKILQNKFKLQDFEKPQKDPTLAHKLERIFGILVYYQGYRITNNIDTEKSYAFKMKFVRLFRKIINFFYRKKIINDEKVLIKVLKIPVFQKKIKL